MLVPFEGLDVILSVISVIVYDFLCHTLKDIIMQMYEKKLKFRSFGNSE